jgi:multidrug efflux system membrane fusion protein
MNKNRSGFRSASGARRACTILFAGIAFTLASCSKGDGRGEGAKRGGGVVAVSVASVVQKPMLVEVRAVGTVEAFSSVSITAQVGGRLQTVHFREGDAVKKGELLFTIDTRPYRATLGEARAGFAKNEVLATQARDEANRYKKLVDEGVASRQEYERARANAEALEATLKADKAVIASASINVNFATITAPIDGRTGGLLVHAGNVVKPTADTLVVIRQVQPIYVRFAVPEQHLGRIRERMTKGPVAVRAIPRGDSGMPARGELTFIENTINPATGTIDMKAEFPNADDRLWPGQFANVTLELALEPNAIVVPEAAVQNGQKGDYVFVVDGASKAELRPVKVLRQLGNEFVVSAGVAAGERVVIDGHAQLTPGAKVQIKAAPPPSDAAAPPSAERSRASSGAKPEGEAVR